jgi:hypothetical protein
MKLSVSRAVIWAASIEDRPGALAEKLEGLGEANLDFILARRAAEAPGQGVVFVAPLKGRAQVNAASQAGFLKTEMLHALCVEGTNQAGFGGRMARAIADAGINLRGFSATASGSRFLAYLAFDDPEQVTKAMRAFKRLA